MNTFHIIWLVGWALYMFGIYTPHARRFRRSTIAVERSRVFDVTVDMLGFLAWQILPLLYIFTSWFNFADYMLPVWSGWIGVVLFGCALILLWFAYRTLGTNWSPKIDIRQGQELVTEGIYGVIRHPIYAGMWLWALAHPFLFWNWIVGWAWLVIFAFLYWTRTPREEEMLREHFGEAYERYVQSTGRIFPRRR